MKPTDSNKRENSSRVKIENVEFLQADSSSRQQQQQNHRHRRQPSPPSFYPIEGNTSSEEVQNANYWHGYSSNIQQQQQQYYAYLQQQQQRAFGNPQNYSYMGYAAPSYAAAQQQQQQLKQQQQQQPMPPGYVWSNPPQQYPYFAANNPSGTNPTPGRGSGSNSPTLQQLQTSPRPGMTPQHPLKQASEPPPVIPDNFGQAPRSTSPQIWSGAEGEQTALLNSAGGGGYGATGANRRPPASKPPARADASALTSGRAIPRSSHRRAKSDTPLGPPKDRRAAPSGVPPQPPGSRRKTPDVHNRARSLSANHYDNILNPSLPQGIMRAPSSTFLPQKKHHRRNSSLSGSVFSTSSMMTDASMATVVTDIRKSSFFGGYNDQGRIEMNFPLSAVHLTMQEDIPKWRLYCVPVDPGDYERYHTISDDIQDELYDDDFFDNNCTCNCPNCNGCTAKKELLPPQYFVMGVEDDLYKRVVDEMCESASMPCGLFFCGHHEDVNRPSITIAVCFVTGLMLSMGAIAFCLRA